MKLENGILESRNGHGTLGTAPSYADGTLIGNPIRALIDFETSGADRKFVAITDKHQLHYNTTDGKWDDVTTKKATAVAITAVNTGNKKFTVAGNRTGDFNVDGAVVWVNSGANKGMYTMDGVAALDGSGDTEITVDQTPPSATVAGAIAMDVEWSGTSANFPDWTVGVDTTLGRLLVVTNNVNKPRYWTGSSQFVDLSFTGLSSFVTCKTVEVLNSYLVLGNVLTANRDEHAVSWSNTGDFNDFTSTTNSGSAIIADSKGAIERLIVHSDRLAVFSKHSISTVIHVGGDLIFSFDTLVEDINLVSPRMVVSVGPFLYYADVENVFIFDGTRQVLPAMDQLKDYLKGTLDHDNAQLGWAFHDFPRRRIYWSWPQGASLVTTLIHEYDLSRPRNSVVGRASYRSLVHAMGIFTRDAGLTWNDLSGLSWDSLGFKWEDEGLSQGFPVLALGDENGRVFIEDGTLNWDNGVSVQSMFETREFVVPQEWNSRYGRWTMLEFEAKGTNLEVEAVSSEGLHFRSSAVSLSSDFTTYQIPIDLSGRGMKFRISDKQDFASSDWFHVRWIKAWVGPGGVR